MSLWTRFRAWAGPVLWRSRAEREMNEELRFHIDAYVEDLVRAGLPHQEAQRRALAEFGGVEQAKEECRDVRGLSFLDAFLRDLRFGLRQLRKHPAFTAVAIITLALGIGANTAIFSVVNTVLLRPLPYKDAERLVTVWGQNHARSFDTDFVSPLDFADWRSQSRAFESMAASTDVTYNLTGAGEPELIIAYAFSPEFFQVLGAPPLLGRTFSAEEQSPGKNHVVVLSYALWQSRFGGDRNLLNQTIHLDGEPYTVIGIMPRGFQYPPATELWTPLAIPPEAVNDRAYRYLRVIARLKPDATVEQARTEMNAIAQRLSFAYPKTNKDESTANLIPLRQWLEGDVRPILVVLLCAVGFVLLISCANLANLLLARAIAREKEVEIRGALGATRFRLVRQFLTESLAIAILGGAAGLFVAWLFTNKLVAMFPQTIFNLNLPKLDKVSMDGSVLAFAVALSLLSVLFFGLMPALQLGRPALQESLRVSARSSTAGSRSKRLRSYLVVLELALSLILLTAAGLTLKSFVLLLRSDVGFRSEGVLTLRIILPEQKYKTPAQQQSFSDEVLARVASLPGVDAAGSVTFLPLSGWYGNRSVSLAGEPESQQHSALWSSATPDYFHAMGIPLLAGRLFSGADRAGSLQVAVVSKSLAKQLIPSGEAVGLRLRVQGLPGIFEVAGVVGDVHQLGLVSQLTPEIYLPLAQAPAPLFCLAVKTAAKPASLAKSVQREIWAIDKDQSIGFVMPLADLESESLAPQRVVTALLGFFAFAALLMTAIGIYGVISYSTTQRTQEIGIRMALGANSGEVLASTLYEGMRLSGFGLLLGLAIALLLTRFLSAMLYGVAATDPFTFVLVSLLLLAVALVACYFPARRAANLDPMTALRYE